MLEITIGNKIHKLGLCFIYFFSSQTTGNRREEDTEGKSGKKRKGMEGQKSDFLFFTIGDTVDPM